MNSDFVQLLLGRLLHQAGGNEAESSEEVMSVSTWRDSWGICRESEMQGHYSQDKDSTSFPAILPLKVMLVLYHIK